MRQWKILGRISESVIEARHHRRKLAYARCALYHDPMDRNRAMRNTLDAEALTAP